MLAALVLALDLAASGSAHLPAGELAATCQWPTVVSFRAGEKKCTGVLVHPEIVVTAAHCLEGGMPDRMRFGEEFSPVARSVDVQGCWTRDAFWGEEPPGEDLGACRLVAPVEDIPPTPLLGACESVTAIAPDRELVLVGFGVTAQGDPFGSKRYASTRIGSEVGSDGTFVAGDAEVNGCDGDSGGPAFVQLADGSWHVAGILVSGPECGEGPSRWLAAATHLAWLEETTQRDLTPCRDDAGAWTGGSDCRLAGDPLEGSATWDAWCDGTRVLAFDTCEAAAAGSSTGGDTTGDVGQDRSTSDARACRVADRRTLAPGLVWLVLLTHRRRDP